MKRLIKLANAQFNTYLLSNKSIRNVIGSHIFISEQSEREQIGNELFKFIDEAYDGEGGFKSFKDVDHFISDSYLWYITYDGKQPDSLSEFDVKKVFVVSVFRANKNSHGLKMVGMARRIIGRDETSKGQNMEIRRNANSALYEHINFLKNKQTGWAEVSGKLERYFSEVYTINDIIDPYELKDRKIFKDIEIDIDELHYYRCLRKGEEPVRKIAYGHIVW